MTGDIKSLTGIFMLDHHMYRLKGALRVVREDLLHVRHQIPAVKDYLTMSVIGGSWGSTLTMAVVVA